MCFISMGLLARIRMRIQGRRGRMLEGERAKWGWLV